MEEWLKLYWLALLTAICKGWGGGGGYITHLHENPHAHVAVGLNELRTEPEPERYRPEDNHPKQTLSGASHQAAPDTNLLRFF